jgi:tetratricopeptide (TPR) repeat protein
VNRSHDGGAAAAVEGPGVGEVLPAEALDELRETARPHAFADAARALADAVVALSEEGDPEAAVRAARAAKRAAPRAASVREALGIALYQVEDFRGARTELAAAQRISGRGDLDAMLADIERALGRPERAIAIFERSNRSRMEPDTAAELLLVAASAYGDLGQPAAGVALIRRHARWPAELADHHLRLAYAEGALAEQAGDPTRARAAFARVVQADPEFHDAADRLERLDDSGAPAGTAGAT